MSVILIALTSDKFETNSVKVENSIYSKIKIEETKIEMYNLR